MNKAIISEPAEKRAGTQLQLSTINGCLRVALASARQVAFDWHIPSDRLEFIGDLDGNSRSMPTNPLAPRKSSELAACICGEGKARFRAALFEAANGTSENTASCKAELRLQDDTHSSRWIEVTGEVVERDVVGRAVRMVGIIADINERKQSECKAARLRDLYVALSQTNQAIARASHREVLLNELCRIAVEQAGFDEAWIGLLDRETHHVVPVAAYGEQQEIGLSNSQAQPEGYEISCIAIKENRPHICNDFRGRSHPETSGTKTTHSLPRSFGSFPLQLSGHPVAALNLRAEESDFFDSSVVDLLEQIARDISFALESHEREAQRKAALADSENFKSAILGAALDCIVSVDHNGRIVGFNRAAERTFGLRGVDVLGKALNDTLIAPEWRAQLRRNIELFFANGESPILNRRVELMAMRADGSLFPAEFALVPLNAHDALSFTAFMRDISDKKRAEALQLGQNRILNLMATGAPLRDILSEIARLAEDQSEHGLCPIFRLNNDGARLLDGSPSSLMQSHASRLDVANEPAYDQSSDKTACRAASPPDIDGENTLVWGRWRDFSLEHGLKPCTSWPIFDKNGKTLGTFSYYFHETTAPTENELKVASICTRLAGIAIESRVYNEKIRYLAHYDGLTSLPNRFLFKEYLDKALRNSRRSGKKFAVLFVDLDKFKEINDTLGHDAGDQVLREIALRMRSCLRLDDKIARMAGDEFYVLIEDLNHSSHAASIAQKLLVQAARPVHIGDKEHHLSASIGISIYPHDGDNGHTLLQNADCAMYRAKEHGKNRYLFFSAPKETEETIRALFNHSLRPVHQDRNSMGVT